MNHLPHSAACNVGTRICERLIHPGCQQQKSDFVSQVSEKINWFAKQKKASGSVFTERTGIVIVIVTVGGGRGGDWDCECECECVDCVCAGRCDFDWDCGTVILPGACVACEREAKTIQRGRRELAK